MKRFLFLLSILILTLVTTNSCYATASPADTLFEQDVGTTTFDFLVSNDISITSDINIIKTLQITPIATQTAYIKLYVEDDVGWYYQTKVRKPILTYNYLIKKILHQDTKFLTLRPGQFSIRTL